MKVLCATSGKSSAAWNMGMMAGALAAILHLRIRVTSEAKAEKSFFELSTSALSVYFPTSFEKIKPCVLKSLLVGVFFHM